MKRIFVFSLSAGTQRQRMSRSRNMGIGKVEFLLLWACLQTVKAPQVLILGSQVNLGSRQIGK